MSKFPVKLQNLIDSFASLSGIGPKSAERIAINLISGDEFLIDKLEKSIRDSKLLKECHDCGNVSEQDLCFICLDKERDRSKIMVVESVSDLMQVESSFEYNGLFLVLGGLIKPLNGVTAADLNIQKLDVFLEHKDTKEIISALSQTVEGQTTQMYIKDIISEYEDIKFTELARGIPSGASIEYLDFQTIKGALQDRREIE